MGLRRNLMILIEIETMNELFEHELIYSGIARHVHSLNLVSKSKIFTELWGSVGAIAIFDLPMNLNYFCDHNFPGGDYSADFLIDNHTTLPYYVPFVLPNFLSKAREAMKEQGQGKRKGVKIFLGENRPGLNRKTYFYYCPLCVIENRRQLGETYWHRLFQIPNVDICPIHHVWLKPTNVLLRDVKNRGVFTPAELQRFDPDVREYTGKSVIENFFLNILEIFYGCLKIILVTTP